jgi:hypothetical protein
MSVFGPIGSGLARWARDRFENEVDAADWARVRRAGATDEIWYPILAPSSEAAETNITTSRAAEAANPGPLLGHAGLLRRLHEAQSGSPIPLRPAYSSEPFQQSVSSPVTNPPISRSEQLVLTGDTPC